MEKLRIRQGTENLTVQELFERFLRDREISNVAPDTIIYYRNCFISFSKFLDVSLPCSEIEMETVRGYIRWMKEQGTAKDITINTNLRGIRSILYFGMQEGYVQEFKIKLLRVVKPIKPVYTEQELEKLLKKPNIKTCTFAEYRNWVMVNYLLGTGNRLETMSKLKIADLDFEGNQIALIHTKNKKQYFIPMSKELAKVLREYLTYRKGSIEEYLFCTSYGTPINKATIQTQIQHYNESRGVKSTSIHMFRHTFAKMWILNGGDILRLQSILGHSTLEMVKEYVAMFSDDLQDGFSSHNPLDTLARKRKDGDRISMKR